MNLAVQVHSWLERGPARPWALLAAAALLSAALFQACARLEIPYLVFAAPVPWLFAVDRLTRWKHILAAGAAMSMAFTALVFSWFPAAAGRYAGAPPWLLWAVFLLLSPLVQPQLIALAAARRLLRGGDPRISALRVAAGGAFAYVAVELAYPKLFFDTLGQGLYPSPLLRQNADLAGVHGLTLLILLVADALSWALAPAGDTKATDKKKPPPARAALLFRYGPLLAAALAVAACLGRGALRRSALASRPSETLTMGLVQANITAYEKLRAEKGAFDTVALILDTHIALSDKLVSAGRPDLMIWPETVYPTTFGSPKSEAGQSFDLAIEAFSATRRVPLLFGAYDAEEGAEYNAAFFLSPVDGRRPDRAVYRKRMLFPLTEWVPEWLDSQGFRRTFPWTGAWSRGPGAKVIPFALPGRPALRVVPLICYDALFPSLAAEAAGSGADLIVTLSNDSWFPDGRAPRLHLLSAALRSVETGLPQVRATNSGVSAFITASGDIRSELGWSAQDVLSAPVSISPGAAPPPAVTWGPRLAKIAWLLAAAALLHALWSRRRDAKPRPA